MESVLEAAEREGLGENLEGLDEEMEELLDRISLTKEEFLLAGKSRIKPLLEDEIALKYYLRRGGVESALRQDTQLVKALELWDGTVPFPVSQEAGEEKAE